MFFKGKFLFPFLLGAVMLTGCVPAPVYFDAPAPHGRYSPLLPDLYFSLPFWYVPDIVLPPAPRYGYHAPHPHFGPAPRPYYGAPHRPGARFHYPRH